MSRRILGMIALVFVVTQPSRAAEFGKRKLCNLPFALIGQARATLAGTYPGQQYYLETPTGAPGPELKATRYYAALAKYGVYRAARLRKPHVDWTNNREVADFFEWLSDQEQFLFHERPKGGDLRRDAQAYQTAVYAKLVLKEAAAELRDAAERQDGKDALLKKARSFAKAAPDSPEVAHGVALTRFVTPKDLTPQEILARRGFVLSETPVGAPRLARDVSEETTQAVAAAHALVAATPGTAAGEVYRKLADSFVAPLTEATAKTWLVKYRTLVEPLLRREAPLGTLVNNLGSLSDMLPLYVAKSQSLGRDLPRTAYRAKDGTLSVTFQRMPDGIVRIEALRVTNSEALPETFVAEWKPGKKDFVEKKGERENCFSCHLKLGGRIDFRAQGMRGAAHTGASARTLAMQIARGEKVEIAPGEKVAESADKVMKKTKLGTTEIADLEAWMAR